MSNNHNTNQFGHLNGGYIGCGIINYQDEIANPIGLESLPTQSRNGFIPLERYYHNKSSKNEGATSAEYLKSPTIAGNNAAVDALDGLSRYNYIASGYENTSVANNFTTQLPCTDLQHVMSNINLINTMDSYNSLFRQQISNPDMFLSSVINDQASIHKTSSHRELPEAIFDINSLISSGNDSCNDFISSLSTSSTTSAIPILQNTISSSGPNTTDIGTNVHDNSDQARLSDLISTIIPTRKRKKVAAAYTNMEASKGISASVYADPDVTKPSTKRMKSWRQKNPQKNKNNDLRCRVYRKARNLFSNTESVDYKRYVYKELFIRRENQKIRDILKFIECSGFIISKNILECIRNCKLKKCISIEQINEMNSKAKNYALKIKSEVAVVDNYSSSGSINVASMLNEALQNCNYDYCLQILKTCVEMKINSSETVITSGKRKEILLYPKLDFAKSLNNEKQKYESQYSHVADIQPDNNKDDERVLDLDKIALALLQQQQSNPTQQQQPQRGEFDFARDLLISLGSSPPEYFLTSDMFSRNQ